MGDVRYREDYEALKRTPDRAAHLRRMSDSAVIGALAAASQEGDPFLANILATESHNRVLQVGRALELLDEGVLLVDASDTVVRANRPAHDFLGLPQGDLIGTPLGSWFLRPSDADMLVLDAAEGSGGDEPREVFLLARDRQMAALVTAQALRRDDELLGTIVIFADLSRRLFEARRRALGAVVTRILADRYALSDAAPRVLAAIGKRLGWHAGALWILDEGPKGALRCTDFWGAGEALAGFEGVTRSLRVEQDATLPGRVWRSRRSTWFDDIQQQGWFKRAEAAVEADLHAAFAVPIRAAGRVVGVFEFFHHEVLARDADLLETMEVVAGLLGQFVERSRLAVQNALLVAVLDAMDEALVVVDPGLRIVTLNERAAGLLDIAREEGPGTLLAGCLREDEGRLAVALGRVFGGHVEEHEDVLVHARRDARALLITRARPLRSVSTDVLAVTLTLHASGEASAQLVK